MGGPIRNGIKYAFTVNPDDDGQYYDTKKCDYIGGTRLHHAAHMLRDKLYRLIRPYARYEMHTEISMLWEGIPHKLPRVHAHGYITFDNVALFLSEVAHKLGMTYKIKELTPDNVWDEYICKCKAEIEPNLPRDLYTIRHSDPPSITSQLIGVDVLECFKKPPRRRQPRSPPA